MLAISLLGTAMGGISKIFQATQARRASRRNYQRQQVQLKEQHKAGMDQVDQFTEQGEAFLGQQSAAAASSGLGGQSGGTLKLLKEGSKTALDLDRTRMKDQINKNYSAGMEQSHLDMQTQAQQSTGAILGAVGGMAMGVAGTYAQGVNSGRFTPGRDSTGKWKLNLKPEPFNQRALTARGR